jgi:hypothetical protein
MTASIRLNGVTVLEDVEVELENTSPPDAPQRDWSGNFWFPLNPPNLVRSSQIYEPEMERVIVLDDGRQGEFKPGRLVKKQGLIQIDFVGAGILG